jgi:hypothetical protein
MTRRILLALLLTVSSASFPALAIDEPKTEAAAPSDREGLATAIAPVLAKPSATGLLLFDVVEKSQAQLAGFQVGDILTHYDGQSVATTGQLIEAAKKAARENRGKLLTVVRRGDKELEAELEAAPLGVRLIPVRENEGRTLWRPATAYKPDFRGLSTLLKEGHRWELLWVREKVVGWSHSHLSRSGEHLALRTQSRIQSDVVNEKSDVTAVFRADGPLSVLSLRLVRQDRVLLDVVRENGRFVGDRSGIPVSAAVPNDAVSIHLAGWVASSMPRQEGACRRCSYLETASLEPAPFADLMCMGKEPLALGGKEVTTHRYELTVFGDKLASFWIDESGNILRTMHAGGIVSAPVPREQVIAQFPDCLKTFGSIEETPKPRAAAPKAN